MSEGIPIKKQAPANADDIINPNLNMPAEMKAALQADLDKAKASGNISSTSVQHDFPTEVIELPSEGYFYPQGHPLSSGKLEMKYMTAKEEDILTSQNLIKKGVVLDKLLESMIVTPGVISDDLLVGDKNAILIAARILAYGPEYSAKVTCPKCGEENNVTINLQNMANSDFDFSNYIKGKNEFEFILPVSKHVVTYKLLYSKDEKEIETEIKSLTKINKHGPTSEITTRLKKTIISINGDNNRGKINAFVDNMPSRDALELRRHIKTNTPTFDMTFDFTCEHCDHEGRIAMPLGISFFWPDADV